MNTDSLSTIELIACGHEEFKNDRFSWALLFFSAAKSRDDFQAEHFAPLGRTYAKLGLFDQAKESFLAFLHHFPEAYIERFQLGLVYRDLSDDDLAIAEFDQVIAQQPAFPPALYYKALCCLAKEDATSAEFLLNELLENTEEDNLYVKLTHELAEKLELNLSSSENVNPQ